MATTGKILGQANPPTAATDVTLYTVPAGTQAQISKLIITNIGTVLAKATVWLRVNGAAKANSQIVLNPGQGSIPPGGRGVYPDNWTLNAGDVVTIQSDTNAALTFQLFGIEVV